MAGRTIEAPELRDFGRNLAGARKARGWSQLELADRCGLSQSAVSLIEGGRQRPALELALALARVLGVPIQHLVSGSDRPGSRVREIAFQLQAMGAVDLRVPDAVVPCAFHRPEEVLVLAVRRPEPDPRIIGAMPALLAWNAWDRRLLKAFSRTVAPRRRVLYRLAWLADVALAIDRRREFPGGCRSSRLAAFVAGVPLPGDIAWDGLGRPMAEPPRSPPWRRWKINFDVDLDEFERRARVLAELRQAEARGDGGRDASKRRQSIRKGRVSPRRGDRQ